MGWGFPASGGTRTSLGLIPSSTKPSVNSNESHRDLSTVYKPGTPPGASSMDAYKDPPGECADRKTTAHAHVSRPGGYRKGLGAWPGPVEKMLGSSAFHGGVEN